MNKLTFTLAMLATLTACAAAQQTQLTGMLNGASAIAVPDAKIGQTPPWPHPANALPAAQKKRADMLISVFENATTELQYGYVENLGDGRGYTAGRAGFCSGCGDLLQVVEEYAKAVPHAPLAKLLPRLREVAKTSSDSVTGLEALPKLWADAAKDPKFCAAQDDVSDRLYYEPALKLAAKAGLKRDFSKVAIYEACIQHGTGNDADGVPAMMTAAAKIAKTPARGGDEAKWLYQFLLIRKATLQNAHDPSTRQAWAESVGRADTMLDIFNSGNMDFKGMLTVSPYDKTTSYTIP
jgi:chitosanase